MDYVKLGIIMGNYQEKKIIKKEKRMDYVKLGMKMGN